MKTFNQKTAIVCILMILAAIAEYFLVTAVTLQQASISGAVFLLLSLVIVFQLIGWSTSERH